MSINEPVEAGGHPDALRLLLGSLLAAAHRLGKATGNGAVEDDAGEKLDARYIVLGAACLAGDRLTGVARMGARAARAVSRPIAAVAVPLLPRFVRSEVLDAVHALDEYGRAAEVTGSREAAVLVTALADDLARDPTLVRAVEQIVDQVQWRVVDTVLPAVLDRLAAEPEQVRALVQGQSRGMVEELANQGRLRAAEGDAAFDRLLARVLGRRTRALSVSDPGIDPTTTALPSGT